MAANQDQAMYLPVSSLLVKNSTKLNSEALHKILTMDFLGLDVYYPSLDLTLTLSDGEFAVSQKTSAIRISKDKKSVTVDWDGDCVENLKKISVNLGDSFTEKVKNGLYLPTTMTLSVNNDSINEKFAKTIYIMPEDYSASFFSSGTYKYSFINGINGLTKNSFKNNVYKNNKVIDAEKNIYLKNNDTNLCWAATASNMLTWTKWADEALKKTKYSGQTEDYVFNQFKTNFTNEGSSPYYAIKWYFNGDYPKNLPKSWAQAKKNSGNFLKTSATKYTHLDDGIDHLAAYIFSGDAVALSIGTDGGPGHAITCWGLEYDSRYDVSNTKWLTGIYITDSDDAKDVKNPADELVYVKLTWSAARKQYKLDSSYSSYPYYLESFSALSRVYPEDFAKEDPRTIVEVAKGSKSSKQNIGPNELQIVFSGALSEDDVVDGGESYVFAGASATNTTVTSGQQVVKGSAYSATIGQDGLQNVSGYAEGTIITSGGQVNVNAGRTSSLTVAAGGTFRVTLGSDTNSIVQGGGQAYVLANTLGTTIEADGLLQVASGGKTSAVTILQGGLAKILNKGCDYSANVLGHEIISSGGSAVAAKISAGGLQTVYGVSNKPRVLASGKLEQSAGKVSGLIVSSGGYAALLGASAIDSAAQVFGLQELYAGSAVKTQIKNGGEQIIQSAASVSSYVSSGGKMTLKSGAKVSNLYVAASGLEEISAGQDTYAAIYGSQAVLAGGLALSATVYNGGKQDVLGKASKTIVSSGGILTVQDQGLAKNITVNNGGKIVTSGQATLTNLTLKTSAQATLAVETIISGATSLDGAKLQAGTQDNLLRLAPKASLTLGQNVNLKNCFLDATDNTLTIKGQNNTLAYAAISKDTQFIYNISTVTPSAKKYLLTFTTDVQQSGNQNQIIFKNGQTLGTYKLTTNLLQAKNTAYTLSLGSTKLGTIKLNGQTLAKNGVTYSLKLTAKNINLTLAPKAGLMVKGTNSKTKLTGKNDSDIFYGSTKNDTITGKNGRDVCVYDNNAWGQDTIKKTSGTMTLVFNGLTKSKVKTSLKNSTMTITKANNSSQKLVIEGWNAATHNIVYTSGLTKFNKYVQASKPTTQQMTAARTEVWKKSGLAVS